MTNAENDATIGPRPAGVNPIHTQAPRFSPQRFAKLHEWPPCWFAQRGVFCLGTRFFPNGSQINHIDNLKSRKNMSGLHSKWQGGPVSLAYPRTVRFIFYLSLIIALPVRQPAAILRTHTKTPRTYRAHARAGEAVCHGCLLGGGLSVW